mgnify:CR=1 FL=1
MASSSDQIIVDSVNLGLEWALDLAELTDDLDTLKEALKMLIAERIVNYANN